MELKYAGEDTIRAVIEETKNEINKRSYVPNATSDNDGMILSVVSGDPAWVSAPSAVSYTTQSLTDEQKAQARANIDASVVFATDETLILENGILRANVGTTSQDDSPYTKLATISDLIAAKEGIALVDQVNGYTYIACMRDGSLVTHCATNSIAVTTAPNTTIFAVGAIFDPTGMVVTATAQDGSTREITNYTYSTDVLTEGTTSIEIIFVEAGNIYTASLPITVS